MISNILLKGICKFTKTLEHQPVNMANNDDTYKAMQNLSIESYNKNLLGVWKLILLTAEKETIHECFISLMEQVKQIWHDNYPCNILCTDADTLCINPIEIFGKFSEFRMFTDNDPISKNSYFNGGIKYFPSTLNSNFWLAYDNMIHEWTNNFHFWGYDQAMSTRMMFDQSNFDIEQTQGWVVKQSGITHNQLLHDLTQDNFKHGILHFHSSQNPEFRLECMKQLWSKLND